MAQTSATWEGLPNELLLAIVGHIPQGGWGVIALVDKRTRECVRRLAADRQLLSIPPIALDYAALSVELWRFVYAESSASIPGDGGWAGGICWRAAKYGLLDTLKSAYVSSLPWDRNTTRCAASGGHLDCLRYAHDNGCPWDEWTTRCAASGGHLDCLRYAHDNGCPWDEETTRRAALRGHLDCLRYAHDNGCPWDERTTTYAADGGHLDCLRYAHDNGCP